MLKLKKQKETKLAICNLRTWKLEIENFGAWKLKFGKFKFETRDSEIMKLKNENLEIGNLQVQTFEFVGYLILSNVVKMGTVK